MNVFIPTQAEIIDWVQPIIAAQVKLELEKLEREKSKQPVVYRKDAANDSDSIESIGLSRRIISALQKYEINNVGILCSMSDKQLIRYPGFGHTAVLEIKWKLAQVGRQLS